MKRFCVVAGAVLALSVAAPGASADTWSEVGDAGHLLGSAQITVGTGKLTSITGEITDDTDVADLFCIRITDPGKFSATTVGTAGTLGDTQLFLFDASGLGVVYNDDQSITELRSLIPTGFVGAAGTYYLAISAFDRDALSVSGFIFENDKFAGVHTPDGPGAADPLSDWTDNGTAFDSGTYTINLTGAEFCTVPELSTSFDLALIAALGLIGYAWRRRRQSGAQTPTRRVGGVHRHPYTSSIYSP